MEIVDERVTVELSRDDFELIRAGLRMLLQAEDDPGTITELKVLIARLTDTIERWAAAH